MSQPNRENLPGVKNVVAVGAGKGGVGKSTIAVLTALGLSRRGARVGLLDADVFGPSIPTMLGIAGASPGGDSERIEPVEAQGLQVMSIGFLIDPNKPVVWRGPMVHKVIEQFIERVDWGELDYLIVDLPPGTGDVPLTLARATPLTGVVIVCTPQAVAVNDARRAIGMFDVLNVPVLGIVENMSYFVAPDTGKEYDLFGRGGARSAARALDVPLLGEIPINVAIRVHCDAGTPTRTLEEADLGVADVIEPFLTDLIARIAVRNAGPASLPVVHLQPTP